MNAIIKKSRPTSQLVRRGHGADMKLPKPVKGFLSGLLSGIESGTGSGLLSGLESGVNALGVNVTALASGIATGLNKLRTKGRPIDLSQPLPGCDAALNISCIRALYNFSYTQQVPSNNSYAVGEKN